MKKKIESDSGKFKTIRHIETVRNFLNEVIREILVRQESHDQSKLQHPEVEIFEEYTPKLRETAYGSKKYKQFMKQMKIAIEHHNKLNRHHPEYFETGINGMNLIDLIEMICDWKAATLRQDEGDIYKSIELNQERFKYSNELKQIFINTAKWIDSLNIRHKAEES